MREIKITVTPFDFLDITTLEINKCVNCHATAKVEGILQEGSDCFDRYRPGSDITILADSEEGQTVLFSGVAQTVRLVEESGVKSLRMQMISRTTYLDQQVHTRTFQDEAMTFGQVVELMQAENEDCNVLLPEHYSVPIDRMLVQHRETDWQFCLRMASRLGAVVIADTKLQMPYLLIGMPKKPSVGEIAPVAYAVHKDLGEMLVHSSNGLDDFSARDATRYEVTSREMYDLCDKITFHGTETYVWGVQSRLEGSTLLHTYHLKEKDGFRRSEYFNRALTGTELSGSVKEIDGSRVRVEIAGDVEQSEHKWFDYASVYSSPDNTGWYFMPDKNDAVVLCFPNDREEDAFVASAVHEGKRDNYEEKSIRTKHGKEIVFAPGSITISNSAGSTVSLDDGKGISLFSTGDISINARNDIILEGRSKVLLSAEKAVYLQQCDSQIHLEENIDISSGHVRIR